MSTRTGLKSTTTITSRRANTFSSVSTVTDIDLKSSTVYKTGNRYYSYKRNALAGAGFPLGNENVDLSTKQNYNYSLICKDAKTQQTIDPNILNFTVISVNGSYNYTTNKTAESFNMVFANLPSDKTIKMTLRVTGDGYLESFAQIVSEPNVSVHIQEIGLVNLNNVPDGVGVASTSFSQNGNGTTQEYTVTIPSSGTKYESATFSIPSGTKFYDKDGNQLSGTINAKIGHFSPTNGSSLDLFNTGWEVGNIILDGKPLQDNQTLTFVTAGFFTLDITDSNGNIAYSIDKDGLEDRSLIVGKTTINPELINPLTDLPYVVGDTIPYWRVNKDGLWVTESTAVVKSENGNLIMEFTTSGFSPGNLDQHLMCPPPEQIPAGIRVPEPDYLLSQYVQA
jgi:hypothetical protein